MAFSERVLRARQRRDARTRGFETALGLDEVPPTPDRAPRSSTELRCVRCGGASTLETLDLRTSRGLARCSSCDQTWSITYPNR